MWDSAKPKKKKKKKPLEFLLKSRKWLLVSFHFTLKTLSQELRCCPRCSGTGRDGSQAQRVVRAVPAEVVGVRHRCGSGSGAAGPVRQSEPGRARGARPELLQRRREGPSAPQDSGGEEGEGSFPGVLLGSGENPPGAAQRSAAREPPQHG